MNLEALLRADRSYRGFSQTERLTDDQLRHLVALTRLTPSTTNLQALKFFISSGTETNAVIQSRTRWAGRAKEAHLPHPGCEPTAFIVILLDTKLAPNETPFYKDVGIAAQTILLGATERGFGGCMIGSFSAEELARALALPEGLKPLLVVALGKPAETVVLHDAPAGYVDEGHYYIRDENDVHHVWKRPLEEILVEAKK